MKRISIITGASSGMGKEFAKQIAAKNNVDELWILARRQSKLAEQIGRASCRERV